ncbi:MAG: hypothetical protein ACRCSK_04485 [Fusobacteriaceae bacterium]
MNFLNLRSKKVATLLLVLFFVVSQMSFASGTSKPKATKKVSTTTITKTKATTKASPRTAAPLEAPPATRSEYDQKINQLSGNVEEIKSSLNEIKTGLNGVKTEVEVVKSNSVKTSNEVVGQLNSMRGESNFIKYFFGTLIAAILLLVIIVNMKWIKLVDKRVKPIQQEIDELNATVGLARKDEKK